MGSGSFKRLFRYMHMCHRMIASESRFPGSANPSNRSWNGIISIELVRVTENRSGIIGESMDCTGDYPIVLSVIRKSPLIRFYVRESLSCEHLSSLLCHIEIPSEDTFRILRETVPETLDNRRGSAMSMQESEMDSINLAVRSRSIEYASDEFFCFQLRMCRTIQLS